MPGSRSGDSDEPRSVGGEIVAALHQVARNQIAHTEALRESTEESRATNVEIRRLAELFARGRRASLSEHVDMVDHVDNIPGMVLRMAREGKLDPPPPTTLTTEGGAGGEAGNLDVQVGGKRVVFISASVRTALLWVLFRLLPILGTIGGAGYVAHDQATRGDRQAERRRLDQREQRLEAPPEPKQLREPRLELPARSPPPP